MALDNRQVVYKKFADYFKDLSFVKLNNVSMNNKWYSKYVAVIQCDLLICAIDKIKCCVVLTKIDKEAVGAIRSLSDLQWISFQTRFYKENPFSALSTDLKEQTYDKSKRNIMGEKIKSYKRTSTYTQYISQDTLLKITLVHTAKDEYEFPANESTLAGALETYQCVISFD